MSFDNPWQFNVALWCGMQIYFYISSGNSAWPTRVQLTHWAAHTRNKQIYRDLIVAAALNSQRHEATEQTWQELGKLTDYDQNIISSGGCISMPNFGPFLPCTCMFQKMTGNLNFFAKSKCLQSVETQLIVISSESGQDTSACQISGHPPEKIQKA